MDSVGTQEVNYMTACRQISNYMAACSSIKGMFSGEVGQGLQLYDCGQKV